MASHTSRRACIHTIPALPSLGGGLGWRQGGRQAREGPSELLTSRVPEELGARPMPGAGGQGPGGGRRHPPFGDFREQAATSRGWPLPSIWKPRSRAWRGGTGWAAPCWCRQRSGRRGAGARVWPRVNPAVGPDKLGPFLPVLSAQTGWASCRPVRAPIPVGSSPGASAPGSRCPWWRRRRKTGGKRWSSGRR